jgi:hypothetical protein
MYVRQLLIAASLPPVIAAAAAKNFADRTVSPCYSAVTAYVADSAPLRIHKIISTGVRRFVDSQTLAAPGCAPLDRMRADFLRAAVMDQLGKDAGRARWVQVQSTDSTVDNDHLVRLSRFTAHDVERLTVHVGSDSDLVSLPPRQ